MTAPGNDALLITLLAAFTACVGYAAGRLHQWYRTGPDRDEAYRDGYDTATRSVFSMAARLIGHRRAVRGTAVVSSAAAGSRSTPSVTPPPAGLRPSRPPASPSSSAGSSAAPSSSSSSKDDTADGGRHLVPDELVKAPTYRLAPDRVARAKVRGPRRPDDEGQDTTHLPSVPRPRSS